MTKRAHVPFTTPSGRVVFGDPHKVFPVMEDDGKTQKKFTSGPNAGKERFSCEFGVAIPKTSQDWRQEAADGLEWGRIIHQEGVDAWPRGQHAQDDFSWKIIDGDDTKLNKNQKRPCDQDGYPGHWILCFSNFDAPTVMSTLHGGAARLDPTPDLIKLGDWVQVSGTVRGNDSIKTAGVYLTHDVICMRGHGERIIKRGNADTSKFGSGVAATARTSPSAASVPHSATSAPTPPVPAPAAPPVPTPVTPDPAYSSATPAPQPERASKDGNSWPLADLEKNGWTREKLLASGYTIA